jgi:hypothetical protein
MRFRVDKLRRSCRNFAKIEALTSGAVAACRELQQQLEACQKECKACKATAAQQLEAAEARWQQQLEAASKASARAAADADKALAASRDAYQAKAAQVLMLQQQLAAAQAALEAEKQHRVDGKTLSQVRG